MIREDISAVLVYRNTVPPLVNAVDTRTVASADKKGKT